MEAQLHCKCLPYVEATSGESQLPTLSYLRYRLGQKKQGECITRYLPELKACKPIIKI